MVEFESQPGVKIRYALIAISVLSWAKHPGYRDNRSDLCRAAVDEELNAGDKTSVHRSEEDDSHRKERRAFQTGGYV
jgi:hypothetical protein